MPGLQRIPPDFLRAARARARAVSPSILHRSQRLRRRRRRHATTSRRVTATSLSSLPLAAAAVPGRQRTYHVRTRPPRPQPRAASRRHFREGYRASTQTSTTTPTHASRYYSLGIDPLVDNGPQTGVAGAARNVDDIVDTCVPASKFGSDSSSTIDTITGQRLMGNRAVTDRQAPSGNGERASKLPAVGGDGRRYKVVRQDQRTD
ncbi:hypothetical protein TWF696_005352 [Orbilia brochopaga]|uniref:Uncharacterized protein n=1 Tax=Orbilia brochopaga TaxID=3140254 RepID=A0AAV9V734_9PEZI